METVTHSRIPIDIHLPSSQCVTLYFPIHTPSLSYNGCSSLRPSPRRYGQSIRHPSPPPEVIENAASFALTDGQRDASLRLYALRRDLYEIEVKNQRDRYEVEAKNHTIREVESRKTQTELLKIVATFIGAISIIGALAWTFVNTNISAPIVNAARVVAILFGYFLLVYGMLR
ncbi:hypothetical protein E8E11_006606 [Didymella keratinophila]|nr:hypothetical protein E8E11_006606 [Didymella keratinophila]